MTAGRRRRADAATESAVLQQVLDLHPTQVTVAELVREIGGEAAGVRRARRDRAGGPRPRRRRPAPPPRRPSCCRPGRRCASASCWTADDGGVTGKSPVTPEAGGTGLAARLAAASPGAAPGRARRLGDQDHLGRGEALDLVFDRLDQVLVADPRFGGDSRLGQRGDGDHQVLLSLAPRSPRDRRPSGRESRSEPGRERAPRAAGRGCPRPQPPHPRSPARFRDPRPADADDDQQPAAHRPPGDSPIAPRGRWRTATTTMPTATKAPTATPTPGPPA